MNTYITDRNADVKPIEFTPTCLIAMSTYNGEKYIKEQVLSIINQVGVKVKILIRDDGSTDGTINLLEELAHKYTDTITVLKGENVGIHKSFKLLFDYSCQINEFDYFSFSDQDDVWDDDKLLIAIISLKKHKADFYTSASRLVDEQNRSLGMTTENLEKNRYYMESNSKLLTNGVQGSTIVITHRLYKYLECHSFPDKYGHDTWIPIVSYYLFDSIYDCNPHMNYRQHNNSWTGNRGNRIKRLRKETMYYLKGLSRYKPLARDILDTFNEDLSDTDKTILQSISGEKTTLFYRIKAILKYKFGKYGWKENLVYRTYYLLGM